jgi:hypothetical protein
MASGDVKLAERFGDPFEKSLEPASAAHGTDSAGGAGFEFEPLARPEGPSGVVVHFKDIGIVSATLKDSQSGAVAAGTIFVHQVHGDSFSTAGDVVGGDLEDIQRSVSH